MSLQSAVVPALVRRIVLSRVVEVGLESESIAQYRRIADVIRAAQRVAIETENAPERRKRLRTLSVQEVSALVGIPVGDMIRRLRALGVQNRARISFEDMLRVRAALFEATGDTSYFPHRRPDRGERLATVAFANFKGGSGKTTSSVHFAQYMARSGYRVLLIDLDSQGSATAQFGIDPSSEVGNDSSFAAWTGAREAGVRIDALSLCQDTYWPTIDLVPAGAVLSAAEESLTTRAQGRQVEEVFYFDEMRSFLAEVEALYDVVVIDVRPDVNLLMTAALHAATNLVVPLRPSMVDLSSTGAFFEHLCDYVRDFEHAFGRGFGTFSSRLLVTQYDPLDRSQEALVAFLREHFPHAVLEGEFLNSRVVGTASFGKETVFEYEPTTDRSAYNRVMASVNGYCRAIERDVGEFWGREAARSGVGEVKVA